MIKKTSDYKKVALKAIRKYRREVLKDASLLAKQCRSSLQQLLQVGVDHKAFIRLENTVINNTDDYNVTSKQNVLNYISTLDKIVNSCSLEGFTEFYNYDNSIYCCYYNIFRELERLERESSAADEAEFSLKYS